MKHEVFNSSIGSPYSLDNPTLTEGQATQILSGLFEQLLIFDCIVVTTNRLNYALSFLIYKLGIATVERLFDSGYLKMMIWSPLLMTGNGRWRDDNTMDESAIYGQVPIAAGSLSPADLNPERNVEIALNNFNFPREQQRRLIRKFSQHYIIPQGMEFSTNSANLVIDSYVKNNLKLLGLPFEKAPDQLNMAQRTLLLNLSHKILETEILSQYNLKSYENYDHYVIVKNNLDNIGKAYNVADNSSTLFQLEGLPNLKELFLVEKLDFDSMFKLRHLSSAKYYRNWINKVGENANAEEITKEYLNELKGRGNFFDTNGGKFVKNLSVFGVSTAISAALAGPIGAIGGAALGYGLGLLDTFVLDNLLKGKNPSMFIDEVKKIS